MAAVIGESLSKYQQLGDEVLNYQRVVGSSAEESGRMVQTFEALGVSEETATQGMFKLSKAIETSPAKLAALGVVVAHDAKGNVDLSNTLLNVADAYNATADQGKKNLILFDAFGKSGKDMIPILEQGSAALKQLEASARLTFSAEDLQRLKDAKIQNDELKQSMDAVGESIGQKLLPAKAALAGAYLREEYIGQQIRAELSAGKISYLEAAISEGNASSGLATQFGKQYDAGQKLKHGLDAQVQAAQDLAAANDALGASIDLVVKAEDAQLHAADELANANDAVKESQWKVNDANAKYQADVKKYGADSRQAQQDLIDRNRAIRDQKDAYIAAAEAVRSKMEADDKAAGRSLDHTAAIWGEIHSLEAERDALAPGSPLRKNLQEWIDKLTSGVPKEVRTRITADYIQIGSKGPKALAGGGRPDVGVPNVVGERGPEIFVPDRPGTIIPHGQAVPMAAGKSVTYNLTLVGTPVVNDPDGVRRMLQRMEAVGVAE